MNSSRATITLAALLPITMTAIGLAGCSGPAPGTRPLEKSCDFPPDFMRHAIHVNGLNYPTTSPHVDPNAPRQSLLPPRVHTRPHDSHTIVLTTRYTCDNAPVLTVTPRRAARTLKVARGTNGGIAAIALTTTGRTIT